MESAIKDHPLWANATIEDIESAMEVINFKKKNLRFSLVCDSYCCPLYLMKSHLILFTWGLIFTMTHLLMK